MLNRPGLRLDARQVSVRAGRNLILHELSLSILEGEFVGVLGPSGCGKSTLLRSLSGQQRLSGGQVTLAGQPLGSEGDPRMGFVPQDDIIHTCLSVEKALRYSARLRLGEVADVEPVVTEVIETLDLSERRKVRIDRLSGGQRKRVSIGVELLTRPLLLFLDEPTSGLDPALEGQFMRTCQNLARQGRTLVMTTHIMQSLDCLDLVLIMVAGRIAYYGPPDQAAAFFQVSHPTDIYTKLQADQAEALTARFQASPLYATYVASRLA